MPIPTVNVSRRIVTPTTAATAGLMQVITVERTGPTSSINEKRQECNSRAHHDEHPHRREHFA
jgi:hypothetical protein